MEYADFPSHFQLMLLAARTHPDPQESDELTTIANGPVDWNEFLAVTLSHRVATLVLHGLSRTHPQGIPPPLWTRLKRRADENSRRTRMLSLETQRICRHFTRQHIELTVLKGTALAQSVYRDPEIRHVSDIDLLTGSEDLPQQIALLEQLGYHLVNPVFRLAPDRLATYRRFWKDLTFRNEKTGFDVDLHWRLFNNRCHPANRILPLTGTSTVVVSGNPVRTLTPTDHFLYTAAHGLSDSWVYLKSLADIAAFLRVLSRVEVEQALLRAQDLGLLTQVSSAIRLAGEWMGANTDYPMLLGKDDPLHASVRQRTLETLRTNKFRPVRSPLRAADSLAVELQLTPGLKTIIEVAKRYAWRPRVWSIIDLPDRLFWLYPVLGLVIPPRR